MEERRVLGAAAGFDGAGQTLQKGGEWLRAEVATAGLRGRGGAAFPVWTKWEAALARPAPRIVVVNGAEDERGGPRPRRRPSPPFRAEAGIDGRPTVVGNAETMAHLALVARHGAEWFRQVGTPDYPGTLLVTLPAECARPGVYEVPAGTPLA